MKKILLILPLVFLFCFTFSCQKAEEAVEEPVVDVEADIAVIRSLSQEISRTWNENDFEGYMALMDEEAMVSLANGPTLRGIEEIRSLYSNSFNLNSFDLTAATEEIHVGGDIAFSRDTWIGSANPKDGGEPIVFDNKTIFIYKKQADSSWKIWRNMYNSNTPLATE